MQSNLIILKPSKTFGGKWAIRCPHCKKTVKAKKIEDLKRSLNIHLRLTHNFTLQCDQLILENYIIMLRTE